MIHEILCHLFGYEKWPTPNCYGFVTGLSGDIDEMAGKHHDKLMSHQSMEWSKDPRQNHLQFFPLEWFSHQLRRRRGFCWPKLCAFLNASVTCYLSFVLSQKDGCQRRMREHMRTCRIGPWTSMNSLEGTHIQVLFKCYTSDSTVGKISTLPQTAVKSCDRRQNSGRNSPVVSKTQCSTCSVTCWQQRLGQQVWQVAPSVAVVVPQPWID